MDSGFSFVAGVTDLKAQAEAKGLVYENDGIEERVIRPSDGAVVVRLNVKPPNQRAPKKKDPTVWLRVTRAHPYHGKWQEVGAVYLSHEDEVENIVDGLRWAVREKSPRRAVRRSR